MFDLLTTDAKYPSLPPRPALVALLADVFGPNPGAMFGHCRKQDAVIERGLAVLRRSAPTARLFGQARVDKRAT